MWLGLEVSHTHPGNAGKILKMCETTWKCWKLREKVFETPGKSGKRFGIIWQEIIDKASTSKAWRCLQVASGSLGGAFEVPWRRSRRASEVPAFACMKIVACMKTLISVEFESNSTENSVVQATTCRMNSTENDAVQTQSCRILQDTLHGKRRRADTCHASQIQQKTTSCKRRRAETQVVQNKSSRKRLCACNAVQLHCTWIQRKTIQCCACAQAVPWFLSRSR